MQILYEDNHLLALVKPPGLPTMGAAADRPSLLRQAQADIKRRYNKPGNVYLGVVSRLDSPASGVVLFARTSKSAARLTEQFRSRQVEKVYWALVEGRPQPAQGECVDAIGLADGRPQIEPGGKEARLEYRTLRTYPGLTLLEVRLHTGRKHQIRLQLSSRGHPIVGDGPYGSRRPFTGIALHARRLVFEHPVRREPIALEAPLPPAWARFGIAD